MANATGDDDSHAKLSQPAGEKAGLMLRGRHNLCPDRTFSVQVNLDQGELATAAEVVMEPSVFYRNSDYHELYFWG